MIQSRIACVVFASVILCAPRAPSSAHNEESIFERVKLEHDEIETGSHQQGPFTLSSARSARMNLVASSVESQSIDVKHYRLQIQLTPNEGSTAGVITGAVTITGETTGAVSAINVDV